VNKQISTLFSKEFGRQIQNRKSFYMMALIVIAVSIAFAFLGITNPLAYPTFIGSFISTD